jgi:hypothetical protein
VWVRIPPDLLALSGRPLTEDRCLADQSGIAKNAIPMATFVHLTPEKNVRSILRNGIKSGGSNRLYAMPVVPCFFRTHQWLRELKRRFGGNGWRTMSAIYFRVPDSTMVWMGYYNGEHIHITAAAAVARLMRAETGLGFQVYFSRSIKRKEILRVGTLPQVVGWRYRPGENGIEPCSCVYCQFGRPGGRRLREQEEAEMKEYAARVAAGYYDHCAVDDDD